MLSAQSDHRQLNLLLGKKNHLFSFPALSFVFFLSLQRRPNQPRHHRGQCNSTLKASGESQDLKCLLVKCSSPLYTRAHFSLWRCAIVRRPHRFSRHSFHCWWFWILKMIHFYFAYCIKHLLKSHEVLTKGFSISLELAKQRSVVKRRIRL